MGHSSVYSQETGLIYVYGGMNGQFLPNLLSYNPTCHSWNSLASPKDTKYDTTP